MSVTLAPSPTDPSESEALWTVEDVSRFLRVSRVTVYAWISSGRIPKPRRIGHRLLWSPGAIRSVLDAQGS